MKSLCPQSWFTPFRNLPAILRTDCCALCGTTTLLQEKYGGFCDNCIAEISGAPGPFLLESSPRIWAAREYSGVIAQAIGVLKNPGRREVAPVLARMLLEPLYRNLQESWKTREALRIVPVPANRFKQRSRGFDQAQLLGRALSPRLDRLVARSHGTAQKVLTKSEREKNVHHQFFPARKHHGSVIPQQVVLVDDVITTGSTLHRCGEILVNLGVREWAALLLAARL
ncbi:comF family protein [Alkalispirochaeta americana]|uniref:ComF family protein n=1 Tax=Alkalispirochaeta americana TaxID=159291 RepID=A0A1N6P921_9SPIO|nr:ComF family protein [Alkalispirochaeta americana]SIQ00757.1 comF family protein [Alkalispirochaeta americana]